LAAGQIEPTGLTRAQHSDKPAHPPARHCPAVLSAAVTNPLFASLMRAPGSEENLPESIEDYMARPAWHRQAACRGVGTEGYIIESGGRHNRVLCAGCPVRQECLEVALADPELVGLWGGTTDAERRVLRRGVA
jgi:hypothetical protein